MFANQCMAYDTLSDGMKGLLDGLHAMQPELTVRSSCWCASQGISGSILAPFQGIAAPVTGNFSARTRPQFPDNSLRTGNSRRSPSNRPVPRRTGANCYLQLKKQLPLSALPS